ncbi:MAG: glycosyltransferase family 4 protein [Gammaproteobacteria bacterium]|nr:glycosyltransferase family 4 protein [Gammaproteobacteria bacterium]NNF59887.1 glycosyltransferase family 4 protein [Gammaproteobacteria bacterium]NNM21621.1 glycosyltransferase family 4 protein [Gammaproteobacteria bacterium]
MRILYHHRTASRDGQSVHIDELIAAFRRAGHEVMIIGPSMAEEMEFGGESGLIAMLKSKLPGALYELLELAFSLLTAVRLWRAHRSFRPDLYYERYNLFSPAGAWLRGRFDVPFLLEINSPLAEERERYGSLRLKRLAKWSENYAWRRADRALPVTNVLAGYLRAAGVPDEQIVIIRNGINRARFAGARDSATTRAKLGLQDALVLGFTGFVREWHGLDEVVELLARLERSDVHLLVVGDGPGRAALEAQARELQLIERVHFTGLVDRDDVPGFTACFDIALQPSVTPYASPLKLFEYMAMGCAIVAPRTPNIEEVLDDGVSARLFDAGQTGALAAAISELCLNRQLREALGSKAAADIEAGRMTWDDNVDRITQLVHEVTAGIPSGSS